MLIIIHLKNENRHWLKYLEIKKMQSKEKKKGKIRLKFLLSKIVV